MVANLINNNGRAVANQFVITDGKTIAFQSYDSLICEIRGAGMGFDNVVVLGRDWNYSNTTRKHLYGFLAQNNIPIENKADVLEALKRGHCRKDEAIAVWLDETMY